VYGHDNYFLDNTLKFTTHIKANIITTAVGDSPNVYIFPQIKACTNLKFLAHRVYMCSNLKYPFELQQIDQIEACTNTNSVLSIFTIIVILQKGQSMKGEHFWNCNKLETVCHQEREDEDIMHILATPCAYIQMPPWPPPFRIRGGQDDVVVWKMNLSRRPLKCKKGGDEDIPYMDTSMQIRVTS
jgi:hypothetical protein